MNLKKAQRTVKKTFFLMKLNDVREFIFYVEVSEYFFVSLIVCCNKSEKLKHDECADVGTIFVKILLLFSQNSHYVHRTCSELRAEEKTGPKTDEVTRAEKTVIMRYFISCTLH